MKSSTTGLHTVTVVQKGPHLTLDYIGTHSLQRPDVKWLDLHKFEWWEIFQVWKIPKMSRQVTWKISKTTVSTSTIIVEKLNGNFRKKIKRLFWSKSLFFWQWYQKLETKLYIGVFVAILLNWFWTGVFLYQNTPWFNLVQISSAQVQIKESKNVAKLSLGLYCR